MASPDCSRRWSISPWSSYCWLPGSPPWRASVLCRRRRSRRSSQMVSPSTSRRYGLARVSSATPILARRRASLSPGNASACDRPSPRTEGPVRMLILFVTFAGLDRSARISPRRLSRIRGRDCALPRLARAPRRDCAGGDGCERLATRPIAPSAPEKPLDGTVGADKLTRCRERTEPTVTLEEGPAYVFVAVRTRELRNSLACLAARSASRVEALEPVSAGRRTARSVQRRIALRRAPLALTLVRQASDHDAVRFSSAPAAQRELRILAPAGLAIARLRIAVEGVAR